MSDITKNTTIENIPEETPEQAELDRLIDEGDYILKVKHLKKYFPVATDFFGRPTQYVRAWTTLRSELKRAVPSV